MSEKLKRTAPTTIAEYRLPLITAATISQHEKTGPNFDNTLKDFSASNIELVAWIRADATKRFPDDLVARKSAVGLTLGALHIVESQVIVDRLNEQFSLPDGVDTSTNGGEYPGVLPPAA